MKTKKIVYGIAGICLGGLFQIGRASCRERV